MMPVRQDFRAVIFDLDGLMIDSERIAAAAWKRVSAEFGRPLSDETIAQMIGLNARDSEAVLRRALGPGFPLEQMKSARLQHTNAHFAEHGIPLKTGLAELLKLLDENRIPKAVATSTDRERALWKLNAAALHSRFDIVVTGNEVKNGKPAPDIFLLAAERLRVASRRCIVLEDSDAGARAAHAAGTTVIVVPDLKQPSADVAALAHRVVSSLHQAKELVAGLLGLSG